MRKYISNSPRETQDFAKKLAKDFKKTGGIIALTGELGAGKTTFVQGFAKGLGIKEKIISPTFVLIRQHKIPNSDNFLFHIDLYRLEEKVNPKTLGLEDMLKNKENIILIEWGEKIKELSAKETFWINFRKQTNDSRKISTSLNLQKIRKKLLRSKTLLAQEFLGRKIYN